ncbi:MAG: 40S ribosomal protein S19 [archaeon]
MKIGDYDPSEVTKTIGEELKKIPEMKPPAWAAWVKTGSNKERLPQKDWWYIRCAGILRRLATGVEIGVNRLSTVYGSRKKRGSRPEHHGECGRNHIRKMLQQLEKLGFVEKSKKGRKITAKGMEWVKKVLEKLTSQKPVEIKIELPYLEKKEGKEVAKPKQPRRRTSKKKDSKQDNVSESTGKASEHKDSQSNTSQQS